MLLTQNDKNSFCLKHVDVDTQEREKRRKLSSLYSQQLLPQLQGTTDVRNAVARFFLAEGIPFSKVESHFFRQMAEALKKGVQSTQLLSLFERAEI